MSSGISLRGFGFKVAFALVILQSFVVAAKANTFDFFPVPSLGTDGYILGMTAGPDGNVWFTELNQNKIGKVTQAGVVTEYALPNSGTRPVGIAAGPDGNLWYVYENASKIGRISPDGVITEFPKSGSPQGARIAAGPDGNMWFTTIGAVGRITTQGVVTLFPLEADTVGSNYITGGLDGNVWFTTSGTGSPAAVRRITPSGTITTYPAVSPRSITRGPDGNLWFSENENQRYRGVGFNKIANITPAGAITEFPIDPTIQGNPNFELVPSDISAASDGALWFFGSLNNEVYRITTQGAVSKVIVDAGEAYLISFQPIVLGPDGNLWMTGRDGSGLPSMVRFTIPGPPTPLVSAVLPSSRSVQTGSAATAFATILNSGPSSLSNCRISPFTSVPATFGYQTTSSSTNALTGSPNTPATIAAGSSQSFLIAFAANAPFASTDVRFNYMCDGVSSVKTISGINTLQLSIDANPVPDMIAVGLTPSNDGYSRTNGVGGTGLFVIATSNVGSTATLTARARPLDSSTAANITVCETNPSTGVCKSPPSASVSRSVASNETATWAAFATATSTIAPDAAKNRLLFEFVDAGGVVRGSTSTGLTTQ